MEPHLTSDVRLPPQPPTGSCGARGKYARSRRTLDLNQRLIRDLARHLHLHPRTGEEVRKLLGASPKSLGSIRREIADINQNDQRNATPRSGHALDVDGRWRKVYGVGARVAVGLCRAVAERHENVEVAFLPGNHDEDAALTLAVALELHFEEHPRITVAAGSGIHWFRRFGRCLLGATHGHTMKPDRMAMMLVTARDWGETDHRHFFFGQIHHETAKEVGPV